MTDLIERAKAALEGATPGPWFVQKDPEAGLNIGYFVSGGGFARADMTGPGAAQGSNARLIAMAPDLARALIETTAERDALRVLLVEARDELAEYANADWPEPSRSQYPDMMSRWKRDMDLCWRIDAALQEDTPND
jgi:hypothetical protein